MPGRIPTDVLLPYIEEYLGDYETDEAAAESTGKLGAKRILAERSGVLPDTLYRMLNGRARTIDFDTADRLISAMNQTPLWHKELAEFYYSVDLSGPSHAPPPRYGKIRCSRPGCENLFVPKSLRHKYCSPTCRNVLCRPVQTRRGPGNKWDAFVCRAGHVRTPENTGIVKATGRRVCKTCRSKAQDRYRATHREQRRASDRERWRRKHGSG